jgi:RNA polymerase sigma-70 factor (ECF subfamily)
MGTDREIWLWNEIRCDNEHALQQLYMHCYDHLFRYGLHLTGDRFQSMECINEVFTEIWIKRDRLPEVKHVQGYLFIMLKRKLSRTIRQRHTVLSMPEEDLMLLDQNDPSYEELLIAFQFEEEKKLRVRLALDQLTPRQKELIRMRYYEERSIEDIADCLQISLRTIYNTIHSAVTILRKELDNDTQQTAAKYNI